MESGSSRTLPKAIGAAAIIAVASGVGVAFAAGSGASQNPIPLIVMGAANLGAFAVALFLIALSTRTDFASWMRGVAHQSFEVGAEALSGGSASKWPMRSFGAACRPLADAWRESDARRLAAVREVEIRQRLSEDERAHFETVLQCLRDAVVVSDSFGDATLMNAAARSLFGVAADAPVYRPLDEVVSDPVLRDLIAEVTQAGVLNKRVHLEHTIDDPKSGTPLAFDVTSVCLPGDAGAAAGVVTILRDMTREREINRLKSEFVSQASHELRTPLSSVNAYLELLIDGEVDGEEARQESYQIIKSETERVTRMIDNMLNISRIEAGITTPELDEVDFHDVAARSASAVAPRAAEKGITITVQPPALPCTARADRDMVQQVFINLLGNAIKYTPEGGRVTVQMENDETSRGVLVTVTDTGLGIPADAVDKVFDKFYRIESYRRIAQGTGLGLNLVRHIVETLHRGQVGVTSEVGMGSRFWFTIPYEVEAGVSAAA